MDLWHVEKLRMFTEKGAFSLIPLHHTHLIPLQMLTLHFMLLLSSSGHVTPSQHLLVHFCHTVKQFMQANPCKYTVQTRTRWKKLSQTSSYFLLCLFHIQQNLLAYIVHMVSIVQVLKAYCFLRSLHLSSFIDFWWKMEVKESLVSDVNEIFFHLPLASDFIFFLNFNNRLFHSHRLFCLLVYGISVVNTTRWGNEKILRS